MTASQQFSGKKADPRYTVRIAVFNGTYQKRLLHDYSIDISIGGLFVETGNILPVNKEVIVKFTLPESDNPIISRARVAWTNEPGFLKKSSLPPGMGLQFINLSLDNMRAIRAYLDNVARNAAPDARISS